ncbi:MAG: CocE/NonD family hydrolase [Rhizobiales bacterium]|nr:CocE/NonD family hydrolase [Hyphomicrobiales bacterium]
MFKQDSEASTVRHEFPFAVETIDPLWITLADGTRLAATLWRPRTDAKVPVVVEMIPYRRRDGTLYRDLELHPYVAGHGIACCRIDTRGSGDSDGLLTDEYLQREQQDACEAIAWLARQDWCNGNVGMTGISWGGFNALQVAALRPPALKAIITLCSSDDRYADDVHYMGGALLTENEMWSNFMLGLAAMPPDPQIVGTRWRAMWRQRLAANRSWSERWLRHQRRDQYWKQGSVCEDFSAIRCAVMAVCGWEDSYSNSVPRLMAGLTAPKLAIMGPWTHTYPCRNDPGPRIGYLQEAIRWWKHWLCGEDTGIMAEPLYRVWITGEERPRPWYKDHAGHWAAEEAWPSPRIDWQTRWLNDGRLGRSAEEGTTLSYSSPATAGTDFGRWGGYGGTSPDLAIDQRRDDGQSLCFDSEVLGEDLVLLGAAELDLELMVDTPLVNLAVRLCDVYPDGTSAVMTYGVLNLSHHKSHEAPEPCPVGTPFRIAVRLNDFGRTVPRGHRLRLAIQNQFWFVLWPQAALSLMMVASGRSRLRLPVRPPHPRDAEVRFAAPEISAPAVVEVLREGHQSKTVEDDLATGFRTIHMVSDSGTWRIADRAITCSAMNRDTFIIHPHDPTTARLITEYRWSYASGPADVSAVAHTELTADVENFHLHWRIEVREKDQIVHAASETKVIPRDFC